MRITTRQTTTRTLTDLHRAWDRRHPVTITYTKADGTETIRIVSLRQEINHGINRDFPTTYRTRFGQTKTVGFIPVSVQRDGRDEPYEQSSLGNGVRLHSRVFVPEYSVCCLRSKSPRFATPSS